MTRFSAEQTSRFVRIEDGGRPFNVHYNDVGDGERVVVMLHGSGPGATAWGNFNRNIDAVVDAGFRVLLIDFPGWGQSDPVVCAESRSDFNARVVKALIDQLQIERITPIGNSMGAHSAVAFALNYPQNLDKLILMGGGTGGISAFVPMPTEGIKRIGELYREPTLENLNRMMQVFVYDTSDLTEELMKVRLAALTANPLHNENFVKSSQLFRAHPPRLIHRTETREAMSQNQYWQDKVVIVTGGASGMGRDVCLTLAARGARVVIGNRSAAAGEALLAEIRAAGGQALFRSTDVSRAADCEALVALAMDSYGRLDGAFNNAGLQRAFNPIHATPDADLSEVIDINLKGVLYMMKYEAAAMLRNGGGAIVNNASIFGLKAMPETAYYVASKHGIVGATRAAALDYATQGIRVNAVCPGPIKTPSYDRVTGGDDHMYDDGVPMHRIGQPREVTEAVLWLLSDQASYVTGSALSVDGGMVAQ